jgi:hypothetical protein
VISLTLLKGIGVDGITTKLERVVVALNYLSRRRILEVPPELFNVINVWKTSFKKQKNTLSLSRMSDEPSMSTFASVTTFLQVGREHVMKILKKKELTVTDHTSISAYLFASLGYKNWQRPSGLINLRYIDFEKATPQDDGSLIIKGYNHKTANTQGPVFFVLPGKSRIIAVNNIFCS